MSEDQLRADMQFLAGTLEHRGSNTESERRAAEYLRDRFRQHTPDADLDEFYSPDNPYYLFASYYGEFVVVSLIAYWWPRAALCYGTVVFVAYLAEFMGYSVMGRFLPQYETQNVLARFLSPRPNKLLVAVAHYDSIKPGPLNDPRIVPWIRWIHLFLLSCMFVVLVTCATQAFLFFEDAPYPYDVAVRWLATACLAGVSILLFYTIAELDEDRGANDNASGVAALLDLAARLQADPIEDADVYLVAASCNQTWMHGARHLLKTHQFDRDATYLLTIDSVGRGSLQYSTREGVAHVMACSREMIAEAKRVADPYGATPRQGQDPCSDAIMFLTRGYRTMGIWGRAEPPADRNVQRKADTLGGIDYSLIGRAADFAEAILRGVARG